MSIKQQVTTYHCDGCGYETTAPHDWRRFMWVGSGTGFISSAALSSGDDYCASCVGKMRAALSSRGLATPQIGLVVGNDPKRPETT